MRKIICLLAIATAYAATTYGQFSRFEPFADLETFMARALVVHLGGSLISDLDLDNRDMLRLQVPGVHLALDKSLGNNIGLGMKVGTKWWRAEKVGYRYRYVTVALRATYHFNLLDRLDPYLGLALTARRFSIGNGHESVGELRAGAGFVVGTRYYLTERLGAFLEYAGDGIGRLHGGLAVKLN
jgi:hypothetical protein